MNRRVSARDLAAEALAGVLARPVRSALTTLGTVVGIATLVITLGVSATAGNRIMGRFDELAATEVTVLPPDGPPLPGTDPIGWDAPGRLDRLNGVNAAVALAQSPAGSEPSVRTNAVTDPTAVTSRALPVVATTTDLVRAVLGRVVLGRFFDAGHVARHDRVAVLGVDAARLLGVTSLDDAPAVFVDGEAFTVIGVVDTPHREQALAGAVIVPWTTVGDRLDLSAVTRVVVDVRVGAAQLIARQAPVAIDPNGHGGVTAVTAPPPTRARDAARGDVNGLFVVLGLVSLAVGAIGIANVTLVTVMERVGEIGLRRALGAARRHIVAQFLAESVIVGTVGGVAGCCAGVPAVVCVAAARSWTPVLDLRLAAAAPVAGALVGLVAGAYPAWRAARLEPVDALRAGT